MIIKYCVLAVYALLIVSIGIVGLRKTKSFSDFFLGGGNVGPWLTAFTYGTAYFSAVLFIGFAGKIGWNFGYSGLWIAAGNALIGVCGVWWLLGPRVKKMSVEYGISTMGEFLEKRYNSRFIKIFGSISIFVFFIPYSAAVFMGLSYLFESNFGWPYWTALLFMGSFTAIYMSLGGYKSMTMIDLFFGIIMSIGVFVLLWVTLNKGGGLSNISSTLFAINPKLIQAVGPPGIWSLLSLIFLTSVAPFGMPQLIQKFYAIKDERSIKIGMIVSTIFALLIGGVAYFVGASSRFFLNADVAPRAFNGTKPIYDALMPELLVKIVPDSLTILLLLVILSASMSTLAALVLISSSSVTKDFYQGFVDKNASDQKLTRLMRFSSIFFILLSVTLAYFKPAGIVAILGISWGAIGSVFLGPFIWGLFTKKMGKVAAFSGSIVGLTACIGLYIAGYPSPQAGSIGMLISLILPWIVTLLKK